VINPEVFEDARRLLLAGADQELVLVFLRERGFDKIDSINTVRKLLGKSTSDAKQLIDLSQAWSDRYESDRELRIAAQKAVSQLAAEDSAALPKIEHDTES
jgi:hypothetical protein